MNFFFLVGNTNKIHTKIYADRYTQHVHTHHTDTDIHADKEIHAHKHTYTYECIDSAKYPMYLGEFVY